MSYDIVELFFSDLKKYNNTNFKALQSAELSDTDYQTIKAFSSAITRYFIFCEKHPEIDNTRKRMLYFQLKLDMVARFFSDYPVSNVDDLRAFQIELGNYHRKSVDEYA